jgi:hypothetical protein
MMAEIKVGLITEEYASPFVLRPATVTLGERYTRSNILVFSSLNATVEIYFVEATTDCTCRNVELELTNDVLWVVAGMGVCMKHDVLISVI